MQFWDNIINTAMMGTDKKTISEQEVNDGLLDAFKTVQSNPAIDKEEKFLQTAALAFNYRQSGALTLKKELSITPASTEEKNYCNPESLQTLQDILNEENIPLLNFWLTHCNNKQQIVTAAFIPILFSLAVNNKILQTFVSNCCGNRGFWLASFNPEWNFGSTDTPENIWQTGSLEQRKIVLQQVRETEPAAGLQWLQQTWQQEDAAVRAAFLDILRSTVNEGDIPFLESLVSDKSKKVKEIANELLRSIAASSIVQQYQQVLQQSVSLKKEKVLLGLGSKTSIEFHLLVTDDRIYKTGIDKLSNNKEHTDDEFILLQLTEYLPPAFWEHHLQANKEQVIQYLQSDNTGKKLIPALVNATVRFKDVHWAKALQLHSEIFYIDIIPLLQPGEQDAFCIKFMQQFPDNILQHALKFKQEWSPELAFEIFKHTAKNTYQYTKTFYSNCLGLIPQQVLAQLNSINPGQEYYQDHWNNMSAYITKLVQLKQQTLKNFN